MKERYTATLSDFKGVDLNTSPLRVAKNRAVSMRNFICDNGINHKRPGWQEQFRITDADGNALAVHGVFPFNEGEAEVLLVHAGTHMYRAAKNEGDIWETTQLDDEGMEITENRSQCFYRGGKAFIVGCGNFLCYGKHGEDEVYTLKAVADIAYVPTTSIGIGYDGSGLVAKSLDSVNLLTCKRINMCVGMPLTPTGYQDYLLGTSWRLDGILKSTKTVEIEIEAYTARVTNAELERPVKYKCKIKGSDDGYLIVSSIQQSDVQDSSGKPFIYLSASEIAWEGSKIGTVSVREDYVGGERYSEVSLWAGTQPLVDGEPNVKICYEAEIPDFDNKQSNITKARFGTTFGVSGANDRLFLAGGPNHANMDWWSEVGDFTYFPDGNTMEVGGSHAAITAYARLSDTTLAVMKEEKAGEPTIFYRTGRERTESDGITMTQWFPVSAGIAGDGTVNPHAVATLSGDVLTLTREGVHALVLSSNVASSERYTRERSRPIYPLLSKSNLENAAAIVYRNRYYLAIDGKCCVADAHYKAAFDGSTDYNYEWWIWDSVPACCFAEYDDNLLFGTNDGLVCLFVKGSFADEEKQRLLGGECLISDGALTYFTERDVCPGDRLTLNGNVYIRRAVGVLITGNRVYPQDISCFHDGQRLYADGASGSGLDSVSVYEVMDVDVADGSFLLYRVGQNGELSEVATKDGEYGELSLLESCDGRTLYVHTVDNGVLTVCEGKGEESKALFLINSDDALTVLYSRYRPVAAEWLTPIMDMGTNTHLKTLTEITVAGEPSVTGSVTVSVTARNATAAFVTTALAHKDASQLDFGDLRMERLSFGPDFPAAHTKRATIRNFNFLALRFSSDTDEDCAVSEICLTYKINSKNRGVR